MISADELRRRDISSSQNGYDKREVNALLEEAAETIEAYVNQGEELYHKMEVLASKIEEYRAEEDIIKTAIIKAEKTAEEIRVEAKDKKKVMLDDANAQAEAITQKAQQLKDEAEKINADSVEQAEKIVAEARERAAEILKEKTEEGNLIIANAEKKANEAINSSKVVAQNILDQAKEISTDLLEKSREEKEAYELLIEALKGDAKAFLESVKALYKEQLEILDKAKLESDSEVKAEKTETVVDLQQEVENLVSEMEEMESAIPASISIDEPEEEEISEPEEAVEEIVEEIVEEPEEEAPAEESTQEEDSEYIEIVDDNGLTIEEEEEEPADPMEAVAAFSRKSYEEPQEESLFNDNEQAFESFFNVSSTDAHGDRSQVISLIPPDDDEDEDDAPRFKGFFKRKNK